MGFDETRLPLRLAFGSTGGVERRTEVVTLASGFEHRATPWEQGRRRFLIGAGLRSLDDMAELTAFFEARRGRLRGFRFRDFADFKSCAPGGAVSVGDQNLGDGDGSRTRFQLIKAIGDVVRRIHKPVDGTVRIAVGGEELALGDFATNLITGEVELATPAALGAAVTAGFEFDTPVRFDTDRIEMTLEGFGAGRLVAVPLVEVRL